MFRKKTSKTKREKTKRIDEEKEAAQEDRLTNYFLRADKKNCGHCERQNYEFLGNRQRLQLKLRKKKWRKQLEDKIISQIKARINRDIRKKFESLLQIIKSW